jgi:hypothetical protein
MSSSILFDLFGIREKAGNYVPFIVWANFISSLFYLLIAYYYFSFKRWSGSLLIIAAIILIIAFIGLRIHINLGGIFNSKIIGILYFRIYFTLILSIITYKLFGVQSKININ